jgi:hypothetical protein
VEEVGEGWTQWRRRSVVPGCFDVEEERGAGVEAHVEEGARCMQTRMRSGRRWVCGGEIKRLGLRGSSTLKKKNSSDRYNDVINARCYI